LQIQAESGRLFAVEQAKQPLSASTRRPSDCAIFHKLSSKPPFAHPGSPAMNRTLPAAVPAACRPARILPTQFDGPPTVFVLTSPPELSR